MSRMKENSREIALQPATPARCAPELGVQRLKGDGGPIRIVFDGKRMSTRCQRLTSLRVGEQGANRGRQRPRIVRPDRQRGIG